MRYASVSQTLHLRLDHAKGAADGHGHLIEGTYHRADDRTPWDD